MAAVNPLSRELVFKIVYYGPGLGGKTTSLEYLHATAKPEHRGKLVSLATPVDRTLYFDFLPVRLPPVRGMNVRLQLFTVPGQVYFNATRKLVLTGADGIVFVSDSQQVRADANLESLENLRENLADQGRELGRMPLVFQHNKRDLPDLHTIEELDTMLNPWNAPSFPTCAKTGMGIYEALDKISERVIRTFEDRMGPAHVLGRATSSTSFEVAEGGLVSALRGASESQPPPSAAVVARISEDATPWPTMPPDATLSAPPAAPPESTGDASKREAQSPAPGPEPDLERDRRPAAIESRFPSSRAGDASAPSAGVPPPHDARTRATEPLPAPPPVAPIRPSSVPRAPSGLSFAELWPDAEQDTVREVELALASRRWTRAVELCDALVSRIFASAATLFGTTEAPRDQAVVPMLLGLDGRRYLGFRAIVRQARAGGHVEAREALSAFAFAIDARLARSAI